MKKIIMNEEFFNKVAAGVLRKTGLDADGEDLLLTTKATMEVIAEELGDNKTEEGGCEITLPGYITFGVSEREGNFGVSVTAEEEIKKRIKDDDMLSDEDEE